MYLDFCSDAGPESLFMVNKITVVGAGNVGATCAHWAAAKELGRFNIRVNAVLPGFHPTEMSDSLPAAVKEKVVAAHVLGRPTDMADLEKLVVLLAELPSVSGQIFNVDSRLL